MWKNVLSHQAHICFKSSNKPAVNACAQPNMGQREGLYIRVNWKRCYRCLQYVKYRKRDILHTLCKTTVILLNYNTAKL